MRVRLSVIPLAACLGLCAAWAGCTTTQRAAEASLVVTGTVIMPDSTALFGAGVSTVPPTKIIETDEAGRFRITLPKPGQYTFVATHPEARYANMVGRRTNVEVGPGVMPDVVIVFGTTQRMELMDVDKKARPPQRRGRKRTGG